jgi:bifunctional DNA-binding transcriptional regulator/antitoxin component of YhaV-PrlF toxin-antitoxin module
VSDEDGSSARAPRSLGTIRLLTTYADGMSVKQFLVSSSGQMSLPASARHRWHLDDGGPVDVIDLGFGVLTVPQGTGRRLLDDLVSREGHAAFVRSLADDRDLATT